MCRFCFSVKCYCWCSHVTLQVDRGMSWEQALSRLESHPSSSSSTGVDGSSGNVNGFYVSKREAPNSKRRWFVLATLKDASPHLFRIARFVRSFIASLVN